MSISSATPQIARTRVLTLYKNFLRATPRFQQGLLVDLPVHVLRAKIRQEFERYRHISNLQTIDVLLFKGKQELDEVDNFWQQKTHIMRRFKKEETLKRGGDDFLSKFYEGRD